MVEFNNITAGLLFGFLVMVVWLLFLNLKEMRLLNNAFGNRDVEEPSYVDQPETKNRVANLRIFDNLFGKKGAMVDPYNEAWEGEADPNTRKKTA